MMTNSSLPFVFQGKQAIEAVADTPHWSDVTFSEQPIMRPQERPITIAYKAESARGDSAGYVSYCTTTMRRLEHDQWRVVIPSNDGIVDALPERAELSTTRGYLASDHGANMPAIYSHQMSRSRREG